MAEKEKVARQMKEPSSTFVDYLDDDLKIDVLTEEKSMMKGRAKKTNNNGGSNSSIHFSNKEAQNEAFNPDQFPSLPEPAVAKNGSIFATSTSNRGWEVKAAL